MGRTTKRNDDSRQQDADERHRQKVRLGRLLRNIREQAHVASQKALAEQLLVLEGGDRRTPATWAKSISNAETGRGTPDWLHLQWCADRGPAEELVREVQATARICRWGGLAHWTPRRDGRLVGFAGLRRTLAGSGFAFEHVSTINPTDVLWMHRLREPHLIHGVFTLAAAAAIRAGLNVHLLLDDTTPIDGDPGVLYDDFMEAVEHWLGGAGLDSGQLDVRRFTSVLNQPGVEVDLWSRQRRYLDSMTVVQYLRSAKLVPLSLTSADDPVVVRTEARAIRLLTTVYNCAVVEIEAERLLRANPAAAFVTLGGVDEELMWERWRYSSPPGELHRLMGHVYLPRMPLPKPPWSYRALGWRGRRIRRGLEQVMLEASGDLDPSTEALVDLSEWLYRSAIVLPAEVGIAHLAPFGARSHLPTVEDVRTSAIDDLKSVARHLEEGIASWFH